MSLIRCPDGILRSYAEYEDVVKPVWKEQMKKEDKTAWQCFKEGWYILWIIGFIVLIIFLFVLDWLGGLT